MSTKKEGDDNEHTFTLGDCKELYHIIKEEWEYWAPIGKSKRISLLQNWDVHLLSLMDMFDRHTHGKNEKEKDEDKDKDEIDDKWLAIHMMICPIRFGDLKLIMQKRPHDEREELVIVDRRIKAMVLYRKYMMNLERLYVKTDPITKFKIRPDTTFYNNLPKVQQIIKEDLLQMQ